MKQEIPPKVYDPSEERINVVSHAAGAVLSLAGLLAVLLLYPPRKWIQTAGLTVYGITLILMYLSSAWYHSRKNPSPGRLIGRRMDHCAIFLLIAGTYTAVMVLFRDGMYAMQVLPVIWGCGIVGLILNVFFFGRWQWISIVLYLIMGWYIVIYIRPMLEWMPGSALRMLFYGGAFYTVGVVLYLIRIRYSHALWHIFVMAGTFFHFLAVIFMLP